MNTSIPFDYQCQQPFLIAPDKVVSKGSWLQDVANCMAQFKQSSAAVWLLYEPDLYAFSVYFMALLGAQKQIVLTANGQPETIRSMQASFELAILPDVIEGVACWQKSPTQLVDKEFALDIKDEQQIHFYTSGSSGSAKKVVKYWYQLEREVRCHQQLWKDLLPGSLTVASVSHQHIYGLLFKFLVPLLSEQSIYLPLIQFPEQLEQVASCQQALIFISSPAYLSRTANEPTNIASYSSIKQVFSSGGPLLAETASQLIDSANIAPVEIYGSTETGGIAWRKQAVNSVWQTLTGIEVRTDQQNRLSIRSPFLADDNWFETDDKASLYDNRHFDLQGRVDRIVKLEEKRLSLTELELRLQQHPDCRRAKALLINNKRVQLAVVIELADEMQDVENKPQLSQQFRQYLSGFFEPVLLPRKWRFVRELPMDNQGKTSLQMLQGMFS
ncbi:AMP-binding protein [Neptunicella sp. SCSIO 80796]|uniref:AMP-binding protein n=1 Tax=Neptunicella plasticusilytica TaxID=3117012 RepID=UPI003A4DBB08